MQIGFISGAASGSEDVLHLCRQVGLQVLVQVGLEVGWRWGAGGLDVSSKWISDGAQRGQVLQ